MSTPGALTAPLASSARVAASGEGSAISGYLPAGVRRASGTWKKLPVCHQRQKCCTPTRPVRCSVVPAFSPLLSGPGSLPRTGRAGRGGRAFCGKAPRRRAAASQLPGAASPPCGARAARRAGPVPRGLGTCPGRAGGSRKGAARKRAPFSASASVVGAGTQERVCASVREPYCLVQAALLLKKP